MTDSFPRLIRTDQRDIEEILHLAEHPNLLFHTADGRTFIVAEISADHRLHDLFEDPRFSRGPGHQPARPSPKRASLPPPPRSAAMRTMRHALRAPRVDARRQRGLP